MKAAQLDSLSAPFVPSLLRERLARGVADERVETFAGAAMLADISGFTQLTERFSRRGPEGVELLSQRVNRELEALVDAVESHGGDVVKFAGDAVVAVWLARDGEAIERPIRRAARCGLAIQAARAEPTTAEEAPLPVRIGIGAGSVALMVLGGARGPVEFFVGGTALAQMGSAEGGVAPGQIGLSPEAWAHVRDDASGDTLSGGVVSLTDMSTEAVRPPEPRAAPSSQGVLLRFIPPYALEKLEAGQAAWLSELRTISVVFLNVRMPDAGLVTERPALQRIVERFHEQLARFGGAVNKILLEDKGLLLLAAFGLPRASHADNAARAVAAAREITRAMQALGHAHGIGVTTGPAFCGVYGGERRREYSVLGTVVNRAARLMLLAEDAVLCDETTARATATHFAYESLPPVNLKGIAHAAAVFRPASARRAGAIGATSHAPANAFAVFVGRARELATLDGALARLERGDGGAIYITGDRGVGKTALLHNYTLRLRARGVHVIASAGEISTSADAYGAWRPTIAALLELPLDAEPQVYARAASVGVADHPYGERWAPLLNAMVPAAIPETPTTTAMVGAARADAITELVVHLLERARARWGLCALTFDDAHWIDRASRSLIDAVLLRCPELLIIVAAQTLDGDDDDDAQRGDASALPELQRLREAATVIALDPLPRVDVDELAARLLELDDLPQALAELLWRRTGGNPFLCVEVVRGLAERLKREDGGARISSTSLARIELPELPETAMGIALSRIDKEPPRRQLTLKVASVVGRSFAYAVLRDVHPVSEDRQTLPGQCVELIQREFVYVVNELPRLQYAFTSGLLRDAAYSVLSFTQKRQLHREVAQWYERDDVEPRVGHAELGYHWRRADELEKALRCLDRAAASAMESGAYADALHSLRELLELRDLLVKSGSTSVGTSLQLARWHRMRGYAASALGEHDEALTSLRKGLEVLGYSLPETRLAWTLHILSALFHIFVSARLRSLLGRRGGEAWRARMTELGVLATGFQAEYFHATELTKSLGCSVIAVSHAERVGAAGRAADAYNNMGYLVGLVGRARLARRYFAVATTGDTRAAINSYFARALLVLGQGRVADSEQLVREGLAMSEEFGDRHMNAVGESILCSVFELPGRYRRANDHALRLLQMARASSSRRFELWGRTERSFVMTMLGELEGAVQALPPEDDVLAQEDALTRTAFFGLRGIILQRAGDPADAELAARRALEMIRKTGPGVFPHIKTITAMFDVFVARLLEARAGGGDARELRARVRESSGMMRAHARLFPIGRSRAERLAGVVHRLAGKHAAARRACERALALARDGELAADEGLALLELARCEGLSSAERGAHARAASEVFLTLEMRHEHGLAAAMT